MCIVIIVSGAVERAAMNVWPVRVSQAQLRLTFNLLQPG